MSSQGADGSGEAGRKRSGGGGQDVGEGGQAGGGEQHEAGKVAGRRDDAGDQRQDCQRRQGNGPQNSRQREDTGQVNCYFLHSLKNYFVVKTFFK